MPDLRAVLIGLGNIGALNDLDQPLDLPPLTHLRAILDNPEIKVSALIERNENICQKVRSRTGIPEAKFFSSVFDLPPDLQFDIVVYACSPKDRIKQLEFTKKFKTKIIIFEKPLAESLEQAQAIFDICDQNQINALVNFHRRYDSEHDAFFKQLPDAAPSKIIFNYSKGLWNYGSHGIDLIQNWFGPVKSILSAIGQSDMINGLIELESGTIVHLIADKNRYDVFEFEFFYEEAKYNLKNGGIVKTYQTIEKDRYHIGYDHLSDEKTLIKPSKVYGLRQLYEDVARTCHDTSYKLKGCHMNDAVSGIKIIEQLIQQAR